MATQLKIIVDTTFKQTTEPSSQLTPQDKVDVSANTVFDVHSWKVINSNHIRVALFRDKLGDPSRNTWCVYIPHIQLVEPASLKITQNTTLKQSVEDASQLPEQDKVTVAAGKTFNLQSWAMASNNHFKIALLWEELGNPPRNTWYVYGPHFQFINKQPKIIEIPANPSLEPGLPASKQLNVPYKSQLDNELNPSGACNVTSFAMVMSYFQIRGTASIAQLEDELYRYMEDNGLSRWDPYDLTKMAQAYGLVNNFTERGSLSDIRTAIAEGRPCIIHGYFTSFGHIIVIRGYDQYGFLVNDPYGEWTSTGYRNDASGANLHYSNSLIQVKCSPEGEDYIWLHRLSRQTQSRRFRQPRLNALRNIFNS